MRKPGTRGVALLALTLAMGPQALRAGPADKSSDKPAEKKSVFQKWFGSKEKEEPKKEEVTAKKPNESETKEEATPSPATRAAAARLREENTLLRRLAVCDKLMEIAVRTNDTELARRVEQLDERARKTYADRTANLPANEVAVDQDLQVLERHLGPGNAPIVPKHDARGDGTAATAGNKQAAVKESKR